MTTYRKTYGLPIASVLLLLLGGASLSFGSRNPAIRPLAGVEILASMYLLRVSRRSHPVAADEQKASKAEGAPRWLWIVSIALLLLAGTSLLSMYIDALQGGRKVWPVDVFAGVALACAIVWSYLFMVIRR